MSSKHNQRDLPVGHAAAETLLPLPYVAACARRRKHAHHSSHRDRPEVAVGQQRGMQFLKGEAGDRRSFFQTTLGRLMEEVTRRTERRVVPHAYFRPPGALREVAFIAACTRCGDCIDVCPPKAIFKVPASAGLAAGTPMIDPEIQPCTVCPDMPCAKSCPTDALTPPEGLWSGYQMATLELVPERCIAFHGVECAVCVRSCPVGETAIASDATGRPVIKAEGCVGCGVCVRACVTSPSSLKLHLESPRRSSGSTVSR